MDVTTENRASIAAREVVADVLDRERRAREGAEARREKFLPVDVPAPKRAFPEGYGIDGPVKPGEFRTGPVRRNEEGDFGLDDVMGEFAAIPSADEKDVVRERWGVVFPDTDLPGLDDPRTGDVEYGMALANLRREELRKLSEGVEGYETRPLNLAEADLVVVEAGLDISKIKNRRIKETLKRLGDEDFVRDVWTSAEEMTLVAPANERAGWVMQLISKPSENGKRKLLAMTLSDWERMLVVREEGEEREVRLPDPGDGSYEKALLLVRSLFKLNFRGKYLPHDLRLSREFLH